MLGRTLASLGFLLQVSFGHIIQAGERLLREREEFRSSIHISATIISKLSTDVQRPCHVGDFLKNVSHFLSSIQKQEQDY
jgi:hypothetical protein